MVPVSVMLPLPAVTLRSPPMVDAASATPVLLVMATSPLAPLVPSVNAPVTAWVSRVIVRLAVEAM